MTGPEFKPWPKTPHLFRQCTITEKIDGTNSAVQILPTSSENSALAYAWIDDVLHGIYAQSRKRFITPENDNAGFARWVLDNNEHLMQTLGPGIHFGEWWGQGIQRKYGMTRKVFSLFNTAKWRDVLDIQPDESGLAVVPVLYEGDFDTSTVLEVLGNLGENGSVAAPGYMNPEGVVVFHHALNNVFKVVLENDHLPKSAVGE